MSKTYQFKELAINRNSIMIRSVNVKNPRDKKEYIEHLHLLSDKDFDERLEDLTKAIRNFRQKSIEKNKGK